MKILRITALWCTSCLLMKKRWKNSLDSSLLQVQDLDFDLDQDQFEKYQIGTILPVVLLIDEEGNEVKRQIGEKSIAEIQSWLENIS